MLPPYFLLFLVLTSGATIDYEAELQHDDKTYLVVLPADTDITNLPLTVALPPGASITPPASKGETFDFSDGPLEFTITAPDGTKQTILIEVRVELPVPVEQTWFTALASDCEIEYVTSTDSSVAVSLRLPFTPGLKPEAIDAVRAAITGLAVTNVFYGYGDASGNLHPIRLRPSAAKALTSVTAAKTPYLNIAFTAQSLGDLEKGRLEKVEYWLKDDDTEYIQTYKTPLSFAAMTFIDETPEIEDPENPEDPEDTKDPEYPDPKPGNSGEGGGCSSGFVEIGALTLLALLPKKRPR